MTTFKHEWRAFGVMFALWLVMLVASDVNAHGYVVRSIPEDRATLERPPTRLQYWFSESLERNFSAINLRDANGVILASGGVDEANDTLLSLQIPVGLLDDGAYIVELRPAFASDSHVVVESRVFFVGEAVAGIEGQSASPLPNLIEVAWKTALYGATFMLFAIFMVYAYVLVPAWGNVKHARGLLPPRLMARLTTLIWLSMGIAVTAHIIALLHQSTVFFNTGLEQVITGGLWQVVRIGSRFGDVWNVRTFLLVIVIGSMLASHYYGARYPKTVRSFWTANVWVMAIMLGAPAVSSHIAGSLIMPWVGVMVHWLHTLAVAFWLGGVVVLTLILSVALRPYEGDTRRQALLVVMRRFSFYVVASVALVITTGIYSATNWFFTPGDLVTTYGGALGVKVLMVGLLLWVGALHHIALRPAWLERLPALSRWVERAGRFEGTMRLESGLAIGALLLASVLSATPIPEPEFARERVETPRASLTLDDMTVTMVVSPGGVGVNTFDVLIDDDGQIVDALVELQVIQPQREVRSPWDALTAVDEGLYVSANDVIDATGTWTTLVDIRQPAPDEPLALAQLHRVAFAWDIRDDATVLQSRPPSWWHIASAFGVLGALMFALMPWGRRLYQRLDLSPVAIVVAVGGSVIFLGLTAFGVWVIAEQQRTIEAQRTPPARIVNTVLPSAESLARGEALYQEHCIIMQTVSDFNALLRQLRVMRDDDLYDVIGQGWRNVPPCNAEFTPEETWDVVNYFRTFRVRVN